MSKEIIYGIIGYFLGILDSKEEPIEQNDSGYIRPFSGHLANRGDWYNEDWYFKELKYKKRYVNIVEEQDSYIISIDWYKNDEAIDYCICESQEDAEVEVECFNLEYGMDKEVILKNVKASYFIYTIDTVIDINIIITDCFNERYYNNYKNIMKEDSFKVLDFIKCLDKDEALELAYDMVNYYEEYKDVEVTREFWGRECCE